MQIWEALITLTIASNREMDITTTRDFKAMIVLIAFQKLFIS